MFETDDYDQVLSQLEYSDGFAALTKNAEIKNDKNLQFKIPSTIGLPKHQEASITTLHHSNDLIYNPPQNKLEEDIFVQFDEIEVFHDAEITKGRESVQENRKRLLGSLFNHKSKRKFPGPAGLLTPSKNHCPDENISAIEISSQDVDYTDHQLHPSAFELGLWNSLHKDVKIWGAHRVDSISCIKQMDLDKPLASRKAHAVIGFVETVDRSVNDPLIILRDESGTIQGTLHRDAWSPFAKCIMSEYSAIALWKPTIFTTGTTFKRHYLNITLGNIIAIYYSSSGEHCIEDKELPSGYSFKDYKDFSAVTLDNCSDIISSMDTSAVTQMLGSVFEEDHLGGLDSISFLDEMF